jgi:hypothetical protein
MPPRKEVDPQTAARRQAARERRIAARERKVEAGVAELRERLRDILRSGLASLDSDSYAMWDEAAARMVDSQSPGLARMLRALGGIPFTGDGWHGRLLDRLGHIHLLLATYERRDALPTPLVEEARARIGLSHSKERIVEREALRDRWWALGSSQELNDTLRMRRCWLWGQSSQRWALLLDFASLGTPLGITIPTGLCIDADVVFYPGADNHRALVKESRGRVDDAALGDTAPAFVDIPAAFDRLSRRLAEQPWSESVPLALRDVTVIPDGDRLHLSGPDGSVPVERDFADALTLLAVSGGKPVSLVGEWRGAVLRPVSVMSGAQLLPLRAAEVQA